jgi:hypothetical protein
MDFTISGLISCNSISSWKNQMGHHHHYNKKGTSLALLHAKKATQKNTSTPQITDGILLSSHAVVLVLEYSLLGASDGVLGSLRL